MSICPEFFSRRSRHSSKPEIELAAGVYEFESELNVVCNHLTIRGAGQEKSFLSFKNQSVGSGGLTATGNSFVFEDLTVQDTCHPQQFL